MTETVIDAGFGRGGVEANKVRARGISPETMAPKPVRRALPPSETPRDWETLCADALDVVESIGALPPALYGAGGPWLGNLAFQVERLARQVAEIAQRELDR